MLKAVPDTPSGPLFVIASVAVCALFVLGAVPPSAWVGGGHTGALVAEAAAQVSDTSQEQNAAARPVVDAPAIVPFDAADVQAAMATIEIDIPRAYTGADGERIDAARLRSWLEGRDSPMAPYADELVAAGIQNEVDPRLIVGIAAIESTVGQRLPPGSHNAWGWSGSGAHGLKHWDSWPESIHGFTEGLARVYDTDNVDERLAQKYVPPNWEKWLRTVRWVMNDI